MAILLQRLKSRMLAGAGGTQLWASQLAEAQTFSFLEITEEAF